jgi:hypothetical protein
MSTKPFIITADSNTPLITSIRTDVTLIYVSGVLGAATVSVTYKNLAGDYLPFDSSILISGEQYKVTHGRYQDIYLTVANADGSTAIEINAVAA